MTELLNLVDDCLIKVLTYCEIETLIAVRKTCKHLKRIVETYNFPKFTEYKSFDASPRSADKSVIKCIGKHLQKFSVTFHKKPLQMVNDYCEFLAQNVGTNIRNLEVVSDGIAIPSLELLAPILNQLDTLTLSFSREAEDVEDVYWPSEKTYTVDLGLLCPNLQKFTFNGLHRFPPNCSSFRRLESLTVYIHCQYNREIDIFLEKNPQITEVCFGYYDGANAYIDFDNFTKKFLNLEKLCISIPLIQSWSPQMLCRLQKLQTLRLGVVRNNFNEILANLSQLKQLTSISIGLTSRIDRTTTIICQQTLVQLARELKNLQFFYLWQPLSEEVFWDRKTVIDFVRLASKLKVVNFQNFNFECNPKFIRDLVDARKFSNINAEPLEIGTDDKNFESLMKEAGVDVERYLKFKEVHSFPFP